MSSNHRREERKKEIEVLVQQGYNAARAGRHIQSCPQEYMHNANRQHWETGHRSFVPEKSKPYQIQELTADDFPDLNGFHIPTASEANFEILVKKINHIINLINVREYDRLT